MIEHETTAGETKVPLRFPMVIRERFGEFRIDEVAVFPPTLEAIRLLRLGAFDAVDIIVAVTDLPADIVRSLRFPDAEAIVAEAKKVLPAEFVDAMEGREPDETDAAEPADEDPVDLGGGDAPVTIDGPEVIWEHDPDGPKPSDEFFGDKGFVTNG